MVRNLRILVLMGILPVSFWASGFRGVYIVFHNFFGDITFYSLVCLSSSPVGNLTRVWLFIIILNYPFEVQVTVENVRQET